MIFDGTALEPLSAVQRAELFKKGKLLSLRRNELLGGAVSPASHWFLVHKGLLRVETPSADGVAAAGFLKKGDIVSARSDETFESHPFGLRAMGDCDVFALPAELITDAVRNNGELAVALLNHKTERLTRLHRNIGRMNTASTEQAVGRTLYEMSTRTESGDHVVDRRITQKDIADSLGLSREQVNKVMKLLEARGLLLKGDDGYVVGPEFSRSQIMPVENSAAAQALAAQSQRWTASRRREAAEDAAAAGAANTGVPIRNGTSW